MANPEHLANLQEGAAVWNAWRKQHPEVEPDLRDANFGGDLRGAKLQDAMLNGADLSGARGLAAPQLRGTDLTGAKLPASIAESFKKPPGVDEASKNSRQLFLIVLVASLYCWITIFSTTDAALLLGSSSLALPIVRTPIPVQAFFGFAPVLLLAVYIYMHFSLQNLWDALSSLPARFPDGRPLHQRTYPWLMSSFIQVNFRRLKDEPGRALAYAQVALSCVLAWWIVPLTLLAFWARFLVRHSDISYFHIALISISLWLAQWFWRITRNTLRGVVPGTEPMRHRAFELGRIFLMTAGVAALTVLFTEAARHAKPYDVEERGWQSLLSYRLSMYAWTPFGDIHSSDLSARPSSDKQDISAVQGANLGGRDLHGIYASFVYAVNTDFSDCDLKFSDFEGADLRGADFSGADLSGADLIAADLRGARLDGAILSGASMEGANLQGAFLPQEFPENISDAENLVLANISESMVQKFGFPADHRLRLTHKDLSGYDFSKPFSSLQSADLTWFNLQDAVFNGVDLGSANLSHADLRGAHLDNSIGLTREQMETACIDKTTVLPDYLDRDFNSRVSTCPLASH